MSKPGGPEQTHPNCNQSKLQPLVLVAQDFIPYNFPKFRKDCFSILLNTAF